MIYVMCQQCLAGMTKCKTVCVQISNQIKTLCKQTLKRLEWNSSKLRL